MVTQERNESNAVGLWGLQELGGRGCAWVPASLSVRCQHSKSALWAAVGGKSIEI